MMENWEKEWLWVVLTAERLANGVKKSSVWVTHSTRNDSLNAVRGCGRIPLPWSQLVDRMNDWALRTNRRHSMCGYPASGWQQGGECQSPVPRLHLHPIGIQMVTEDPKSGFIVARKSIFHTNSRQWFKRPFCEHHLLLRTCVYCYSWPRILRSRAIPWGHCIWNTGSLQSKQMACVSPGKLSY